MMKKMRLTPISCLQRPTTTITLQLVPYILLCVLNHCIPCISPINTSYQPLSFVTHVFTMPPLHAPMPFLLSSMLSVYVSPVLHALTSNTTAIDSSIQGYLTTVASTNAVDNEWYPDSRATNHFSHGVPLVYGAKSYCGSGKVQVDSGRFVDISNIGISIINTS